MQPPVAFATYHSENQLHPAVAVDGKLYDLHTLQGITKTVPASNWVNGGLKPFLGSLCEDAAMWEDVAGQAKAGAASGKLRTVAGGEAQLCAPFRPCRIFCAASNYVDHADEMGTVLAAKAESKPYMFLKLQNCVIGPDEAVPMPPETRQLDWEVELAAVIGRRARHVPVDEALSHVAAYTVVNDVTARDLNVRDDYPFKFDWFQGKCHDGFAPFGPWLVPSSHLPDPQKVRMQLSVNGEIMQDGSAEEMIWKVNEQIAYLSTIVTLEPGDVVATGTPTGVGMGRGIFLKSGDVMAASIDVIGTLTNRVQ